MPSATYYLDQAKTNPLKVEWKLGWKNLKITHNNHLVGEIADAKELKEGKSFKLQNGEPVSAKLNMKWGFSPELELLVSGKPVPGSPADPVTQVKNAYVLLLVLAALNIGLGLLAMIGKVSILLGLGVGLGTVITGAVFLALAIWGKQKNSATAFMIAIAVLAADMVMSFMAVSEGGRVSGSAILVRVIFCLLLANGADAAKKLKNTTSPLVPHK
ncbi:hypothetical protein IT413_04320 [Candidatus Peregrinibacteria bacterium]|nr:hypothetical protein [Candidatus Peregrinibacteria bacterium]